MPAISTILAAGSLALGAAGAVNAYNQQKKARKQAEAAEAAQKTEAQEAAKLKGPDVPDARIQIGAASRRKAKSTASGSEKGTSRRKNKSGTFGTALAPSASSIGGL